MKINVKVDVVSDVVCPWCYIGKRRLEKAVAELADRYTFEITYHPFELNPQTPVTGVDQHSYLSDKFGGDHHFDKVTGHTTQVAAMEGLSFDFEKQRVMPNTRKLHVVIQGARLFGNQTLVMEAFFKAYFTDGVDLSKDDNVIAVAMSTGLDEATVAQWLNSKSILAEVERTEREMQQLGIRGVPFYIVNKEYGVSGAQSTETFIKVFNEIGVDAVAQTDVSCDVNKDC